MPTTLAAKLQVKPGRQLALLNAPEGYRDRLAAELEGILTAGDAPAPTDGVLLFVNDLAEVERLLAGAIRAVRPRGLLWIAYPKGSSGVKTDVNRDILRHAVAPAGWRPVRQVALDEVWSALRFRPAEDVGR